MSRKPRPVVLLPEDVAFWKETTEREVFVTADRLCKHYAKLGKEVRVVWQSTHCISVTPISPVAVVAVRKRTRNF